ncbi:SMI1/KNR4 family protein [Permianibacter aggregans]|nr:SMI1/KNR4 family protein [Permianibacter aggregans]
MLSPELKALAGRRATELLCLLQKKNGFFAFESSLRVFSSVKSSQSYSLADWNSELLWRREYGDCVEDALFFAEDVFGGQFCIRNDEIYCFDPETGEFSYLANTVDDWARSVLSEYQLLTGQPLAHDWQKMHGSIPVLSRLVPKLPFVCGGEFSVENLIALDSVKGMRARGNLAMQIKDLPDGAQITFNITDN